MGAAPALPGSAVLTPGLSSPLVDKYIAMAKDKHGYNIEQVGARGGGRATPRCHPISSHPHLIPPTPRTPYTPHPILCPLSGDQCPAPCPCCLLSPPPPPQALGMLLWHKHDVEKSLADLANFTPFPDEWTVEDKVLFEQAFSFHGKSFARIQQMVCAAHPCCTCQVVQAKSPPPPGR